MPGTMEQNNSFNAQVAVRGLLDSMDDLRGSACANDTDVIFLKGLMNSPLMTSLVKAHDKLEDKKLYPVGTENLELIDEVIKALNPLEFRNYKASELKRILQNPHLKGLIETHDSVANKTYDTPAPSPIDLSPVSNSSNMIDQAFNNDDETPEAIRMVGIRRIPNEPLGITIKAAPNGDVMIARILHGSSIEKQGLLHVGDVIKEVNGVDISNDTDACMTQLKNSTPGISLKIIPSYQEHILQAQCFVKTHFDYNPSEDSLIPCAEAGLAFNEGDVLEVLNMEDSNWWQARKVDRPNTPAGLIPSYLLEEKRKAFVKKDYDYSNQTKCAGVVLSKKKKKVKYMSNRNADYDRHDLLVYEEVTRMPPFQRKTLVIIGAQGVGRRSLKNRIIAYDSNRFGTPVPHTTRRPRTGEADGVGYHFTEKDAMANDIKSYRFLESGEYEGNLYGTQFDEVLSVITQGKMCVLDCSPQALKLLKTPEYLPYVVFIEPPSLDELRSMYDDGKTTGTITRPYTELDMKKTVEESAKIKRAYHHSFDLTIVNNSADKTFGKLLEALEKLRTESQWVPISWVF